MRFVVRRVDVLAIPAGREHDFQADTTLAVRIKEGLVGHKVAVERVLRLSRLVVVEAVEADCPLSQVRLIKERPGRGGRIRLTDITEGKRAAVGAASKHTEARRESLDFATTCLVSLQVVARTRLANVLHTSIE